jgi:hypothetical protein
MPNKTVTLLVGLLATLPAGALGDDVPVSRLLVFANQQALPSLLPKDTRLLYDPAAIEKFLKALDDSPPDWGTLHGAHGDRHDERLFALNRERDRLRAGRAALAQRITFLWDGVLSHYVPDKGGFLVAIGPELIVTKWGLVRFKPENLPDELVAVPPVNLKESLRERAARGETFKVIVAMTGQLVPDESLIYDFAHEEPGQGMVMPIVRVEQIDYYLVPP